jgi:hypothetical protein
MSVWSRLQLSVAVLVSFVIVSSALATGLAGAAPTPPIHCGMRITKDTVLDRDLRNCKDDGIVFAADGITLDLNGHTIEGDGQLRKNCPKGAICDDGLVSIGHSNLTVEDGTVTNFALGGVIFQGRANRIVGLISTDNQFSGLNLSSADSVVEESTFSHNGTLDFGPGIYLYHAKGTRVTGNELTDNGAIGVDMSAVPGERVVGNQISGNPENGVTVEGSGAVVARNHLVGNGWGIEVDGNRNRIVENDIGEPGCSDGCQFGISEDGGHGNLIARNRVAEAAIADLHITGEKPNPPTRGNVLRDNLLIAGGRYGLQVEKPATGTSLIGNVSRGAALIGLLIQSPSTRLVGNSALGSGRIGISAPPGVRDGGGNEAAGSGGGGQCRNLHCG